MSIIEQISKDLLQQIATVVRLNDEADNVKEMDRRVAVFMKELEEVGKELEISPMEAFFLTGIIVLTINEDRKNILFRDVTEELRVSNMEAISYYQSIDALVQKGFITKIIHDEESIEEIYYTSEISVIPYFNEEYKLSQKAVDKIIKK